MLIQSVKLETGYCISGLDEGDHEQLLEEILNLKFVEEVSYYCNYIVTCTLDGMTDKGCLDNLQQVKLTLESLFTKYYKAFRKACKVRTYHQA